MSTPAAISVADARNDLADLLNRVAYGKERMVITRHGRELAALVPVEDLQLIDKLRQYVLRKDAANAFAELDEGKSLAWETLRSELGL